MTWITEGDETRSGCGRFVIHALPEGYVCVDYRDRNPHAALHWDDFSDAFETLAEACRWADSRVSTGRLG